MHKNNFQFFRMRPPNFPTIRLAQLINLVFQHQNLFSKLMIIDQKEDFYKLFNVEVLDFWKIHFIRRRKNHLQFFQLVSKLEEGGGGLSMLIRHFV